MPGESTVLSQSTRIQTDVPPGRVSPLCNGRGAGTLGPVCRRSTLLAVALWTAGCAGVEAEAESHPRQPPHHVAGGFKNPDPDLEPPEGWTRWRFLATRVWATLVSPRAFDTPRVANDGAILRAGTVNPSVTWIGHSTLLLLVDGMNVLTDPHWGDRASPLSWAGPRRLAPPGLAFADLPRIDVVVISHDHFDHLDLPTVKRLAAAHDPLFLVPLGLAGWFASNGMHRVEELDWWQTRDYRDVRFVCVPAQHFSGRSPRAGNRHLWASWAVLGRSQRFYFGGDTGYFGGFRQAGERLGPFDLSAIAIGAYLPAAIMRSVHTTPEEAVQAAEDLRSRVLLGIHWGTFDLAEEPLDEPPRRMQAEAARRGIGPERAWILKVGETRRW
jgi:N-acyl-phosphatidylethanolamine-hydrolysing phospholipase D